MMMECPVRSLLLILLLDLSPLKSHSLLFLAVAVVTRFSAWGTQNRHNQRQDLYDGLVVQYLARRLQLDLA